MNNFDLDGYTNLFFSLTPNPIFLFKSFYEQLILTRKSHCNSFARLCFIYTKSDESYHKILIVVVDRFGKLMSLVNVQLYPLVH